MPPSQFTLRVSLPTDWTVPFARSLLPSVHLRRILSALAEPLHTVPPVTKSPDWSPLTSSTTALPPVVASQLPATSPDADEEDVPVPPGTEAEADADDEPAVLELGDGSSSEPPPPHAGRTSTPPSPPAPSPA